ncbi:NAD(P)-binding domain-containing protein [Brevibacillus thermoruber]|uniref:NAD(P)-binding domain-containing protein n=1 Tax=Brevibacillus thermoruber TaxID=33942 RepID=UPI0040433D79
MYIGIIGLGSMGQMLVKGFCKSGVVTPGQLVVFNRTREKAERLRREYPFAIASTAQEVCQRADIVFICTKPLDVLPLRSTSLRRRTSSPSRPVSPWPTWRRSTRGPSAK